MFQVMGPLRHPHKSILAALFCALWISAPHGLAAQDNGTVLDELFTQLAEADSAQAGERVARAIVDRWSRSGSAAIDLLLQRGLQALSQRNPQAAVEHMTALIDHAPDVAQAYQLRATAYYQLGYRGPAIADLGTALDLEPRHFIAMSGLAVLLQDMGDLEAALEVYRAVLAIHPTDPDIGRAVGALEQALRGEIL